MATLFNSGIRRLMPEGSGHLCIFFLAFFLIPGLLSAQAKKPDFSGKWTLNEGKSKLDDGPAWGLVTRMTIEQKGNNLTAERVSRNRDGEELTSTDKLTLDGKDCNNSAEGRTRISKAAWSEDGNSLTVKTHMSVNRDGQTWEMDMTEVYILKEKNTLEVQYTSVSQRGERQRTLVYEKSN
jgi:hypothetical protein